jgi:tRNA(Ile)-lysidine synthase
LLIRKPTIEPLSLREFSASLASLAQFERSPFLAVAVSGGPDSLALAILADRWVRERGGEVRALTVDHRLRPESGEEIRRLGAWLSARGIRHDVLVWAGDKPRTGIQNAARVARYRLLGDWCRANGCLNLLTGHHRDDQIETHLIRRRARSGPDGLAGMAAVRELSDCRLLRPLLAVPRDRLVAFLEAERQPFISDPSNFDPRFERSRLRGSACVPAAEAHCSVLPEEIRALGCARVIREQALNALFTRYAALHPAGFAVLDRALFREMPCDVAHRLLSALTTAVAGAAYPPRRDRIARLCLALSAAERRGYTLGGCRFIFWRDRILATRELAKAPPPLRLSPGERVIWDRRFEILTPRAGGSRFTIGYLGLPSAPRFDRESPTLRQISLPRLLFSILPSVWDEKGIAAVPHISYTREGVAGLPQLVFRPVNPLTQAGFAVV